MIAHDSSGSSRAYHRGVHVLAMMTALAVVPLIVVGAGVTSKDAGMAYPDGFFSDGYFWNPPNWWQQDHTRWEHGHRLIGRAVGVIAIGLAVASWRRSRTVRWLGVGTLAAIVLQGVLGIFRVSEVSRPLAMVHGIWGQACFCLAVATALVTSRRWALGVDRYRVRAAIVLRRLSGAVALGMFLQLATGAVVRHFPSNAAAAVHILIAVVLTLLVGWLSMWVIGQHPARTLPGFLGRALAGLFVAQLMLGGLTFLVVMIGGPWAEWVRWSVPSAHVVVGALLVSCAALLCLTCYRLLQPAEDGHSLLAAGAVSVS